MINERIKALMMENPLMAFFRLNSFKNKTFLGYTNNSPILIPDSFNVVIKSETLDYSLEFIGRHIKRLIEDNKNFIMINAVIHTNNGIEEIISKINIKKQHTYIHYYTNLDQIREKGYEFIVMFPTIINLRDQSDINILLTELSNYLESIRLSPDVFSYHKTRFLLFYDTISTDSYTATLHLTKLIKEFNRNRFSYTFLYEKTSKNNRIEIEQDINIIDEFYQFSLSDSEKKYIYPYYSHYGRYLIDW